MYGLALSRCEQLLADDPERQARRETLVKEREKFATALNWLNEAQMSGAEKSDDDGDDDDEE